MDGYRPRGQLPPHGTRARYVRDLMAGGCRCAECRAANTEWFRGYRARVQARERYTLARARGLRPLPGLAPEHR